MYIIGLTSITAILIFAIVIKNLDGFETIHKILISVLVSTFVLSFLSFGHVAMKDSQGGDTMVLNGYVTKKERERVGCSHSYSCNCRVVMQGKVSTTQCDTCYEHSFDVDWVVRSNIGGVRIDRVDRQGLTEPKRYTEAYVGEPFSLEESYFNYIKASPLTVFSDFNAYKDKQVPAHPKVYDYYRVKHVVDWASEYKSGIENINKLLTEKLKRSSSKAKANVLVIFHKEGDTFTEVVKNKNLGGRINDLTVLIDAEKDGTINNVGVFSWSKSDMVNVKLRDDILDLGVLNKENEEKLVDILDNTLVKYYKHRSIEEFKYLEENIEYPVWYYIATIFWSVFCLSVLAFLTRK